jgi:hypothetical protein
MLSKILKVKKMNPRRKFQILFLRNDASQEVEVHEVKQVDFLTIQERLENGESVFITSKTAQKLKGPKSENCAHRSLKTKLASAFYLEGV